MTAAPVYALNSSSATDHRNTTSLTGLISSVGSALYNNATNNASSASLDTSVPKMADKSDASIVDYQLKQTKIIASAVLFAITLLCGYLPIRMLNFNQAYLRYAMFGGGGVLMATAFCHLIPEAHDNYRESQQPSFPNPTPQSEDTKPINWPFPEMTTCAGFFFMYIVEMLMVRFINTHTGDSHGKKLFSSVDDSGIVAIVSGGDQGADGTKRNNTSNENQHATSITPTTSFTSIPSKKVGHFIRFLKGLLIVSAFGAHSIFDGVTIGSRGTSQKVWAVFFAICCHKLIIAVVVGLELFVATFESHLWTVIHLSIFSAMSPIGIILIVIAQDSLGIDENNPVMILLQSFATGTLLYIVFVEILQHKEGESKHKNGFGKTMSLLAGFAVMTVAVLLIETE